MKQWLTRDEWVSYAACGDDIRWITPPESLNSADQAVVEAGCHRCPVRPECSRAAIDGESVGVWCASRWIPEVSLDDSDEVAQVKEVEAGKVRGLLEAALPAELERRGDF